jgi:serine/threonine protein kinase
MSPEQFQALSVDERSDVYSLGVVLYELLTARLPFMAPTPMALAMKHIMETAPSSRVLRPEIPVWLDRVVLQCLEKEPGRRFATAAALAAELQKSRSEARLRSRRLPTGDNVLEDEGHSSEWALVLQSPAERAGWAEGMALRFEERFYRLDRIDAAPERGGRWTYRFAEWPSEVVFRRLVDYEADSAARAEKTPSVASRLTRLLSGRKE